MDPATTDPQTREARMLAAIVFTDVVGFSKLAAQNEARVYVALQRDMAVMTSLCQAHSGQVLNTMGDGMLLCFSSAVDALSCAVEIQRTLYGQSHSLPTSEILHHRIGVHLGDVIMNGDNIFGDGVNVAARLQAMAKPDSVCYSATVHDVVKNKLKIDAKYLGPQILKNLGEPVKVWQVPPLDEGRVYIDSPVSPAAAEPTLTHGASGGKAAAMIVASVALIGILIFGFTRMNAPKLGGDDTPAAKSNAEKIRKEIQERLAALKKKEQPVITPVVTEPTSEEIRDQIDKLKKSYQFDQITKLLDDHGNLVKTELAKADDYKQMAQLDGYLRSELALATDPDHAIPMHQINLAGTPVTDALVYERADGVLHVDPDPTSKQPFAPQQYTWDQVTPQMYLQIVYQVTNHPAVNTTPPAEVVSDIRAFAQTFNVPADFPATTTTP